MISALFISTFLTVFLAELGDKTQIATLTLSGSSKKPLAVFIGSSSALVLATLIGVFLGGSISKFIPESSLQIISAFGFLIIGINLLFFSDDSNLNDQEHN